MWSKFLTILYENEINVNINIQKQFAFTEQQLRALNDYLDVNFMLNIWIPLAGAFSQKLLILLVTTLGLINTLVSVAKWCLPEHRPIWWIKENAAALKNDSHLQALKIDSFSCDTNAGFPSSNAAAFTAYALIVVWHSVKTFLPTFRFIIFDKYLLIYAIVLLLSGFVWFARLYFLYEFLHQCLMGSLIAAVMIELLIRLATPLLNLRKLKGITLVLVFSLVPISAYYIMLYLDEDPFWSVRMAFKWCADPLHLKHDSSPVFIICRDFGYLMGIALSCPLIQSYRRDSATSHYRRFPGIILMEIINIMAQSYTPKGYGRLIFVGYEFLRNCIHSFMLLTILPLFDKQ